MLKFNSQSASTTQLITIFFSAGILLREASLSATSSSGSSSASEGFQSSDELFLDSIRYEGDNDSFLEFSNDKDENPHDKVSRHVAVVPTRPVKIKELLSDKQSMVGAINWKWTIVILMCIIQSLWIWSSYMNNDR